MIKLLANYWLHGEFLVINEDKMAKFRRQFIVLKTLQEKTSIRLPCAIFV